MRGSWKACPRKFFWNYTYEIVPDGENVHLHAGGAFARGLEVARKSFYGGREGYEDAVVSGAQGLLQAWGAYDPGEDAKKSIDRVLGAYEYYHSVFDMRSDHIQPYMTNKGEPAVEFNFVLPIPGTRHPRTGQPVLYAGRFDLLGNMRGHESLFVVDEKTTSQLGPTWGNQWLIRSQFTGYVWGALEHRHPVAGAIVRGVSILKDKYNHAESIVYRQRWQIEQWLETLRRDVFAMIAQWQEMESVGLDKAKLLVDSKDKIVDAQLLPEHYTPFTQSLDQACSAYGGCAYLRLCDSPEPQAFIPIYYRPHSWDPTKRPL